MKAYVFPGQAAQFEGMGSDLYTESSVAKQMFDEADSILGYSLSKIMFQGSLEELTQTKITQPAVFLHSVIKAKLAESQAPPMGVAGHSLGEFSALVVNKTLDFESGLRLVQTRANAMQSACEMQRSIMAAIVGLDDQIIEEICAGIDQLVVPANYNCPGQLVISGTIAGVDEAIELCKKAGAKIAVKIAVGGAFHSPLMEPAKKELEAVIAQTKFHEPICPIYQNVNALAISDPEQIRQNLNLQLTSPVLWTKIMQNMVADGFDQFIEIGGQGTVLRGFFKRFDKTIATDVL
ncbi:MAG: ACP S-malonyltransferase [Saprospiraceae bacterium]